MELCLLPNFFMKKIISIITPVLNEEKNIFFCYKSVKSFFKNKKDYDYEHIFVDNDSKDKSRDIISQICNKDKKVKAIFNKRNYKVLQSLFNSYRYTKGDAILTCYSADMQDPLSYLNDFIFNWEKGFEVISARREHRQEDVLMSILKRSYYMIYIFFNLSKKIRKRNDAYVNSFQLIDSKVKDLMLKNNKKYDHIPSLTYAYSDKIYTLNSNWIKRKRGKSSNNFVDYFQEAFLTIFNYTFFLESFVFIFFQILIFLLEKNIYFIFFYTIVNLIFSILIFIIIKKFFIKKIKVKVKKKINI